MILFSVLMAAACLGVTGWFLHDWSRPDGAACHPREFWVPAGACLLAAALLVRAAVTW